MATLIFAAGCASTASLSPDETAAQEKTLKLALSDLAKDPFGPYKTVSDFPKLEVRTKVSNQRVTGAPLQQISGISFPVRGNVVIGYPATLELKNSDSVVIEITDLEIRRRTPNLIGDFQPFLGVDPIVLQAGDTWQGTFIVSRKQGWYRIESKASAPEGWMAIPGPATRNVYFKESTQLKLSEEGYMANITFWNLNEEDASFYYWITDGVPQGRPDSSIAEGVVEVGAGEALKLEIDTPEKNWTLVTAPAEDEAEKP